jgi:hypothetical protein
MTDRYESAAQPPESSGDTGSSVPTNPEANRIVVLECRLEQMRSALDEARAEADRARLRLAVVTAREAEDARRSAIVHEELAEAREEAVSLHRRIEQSEALRAAHEGRLFEASAPTDLEELIRLRREVWVERERADASERIASELRARCDELIASRETVMSRVADWQRTLGVEDDGAFDLAEFISALRRDILELEHRNAQGERREAALRARLEEALRPRVFAPATLDGDAASEADPADETIEAASAQLAGRAPSAKSERPANRPRGPLDDLSEQLSTADSTDLQVSLLGRLGRSGQMEAFEAIRPYGTASDALVRAAAFEAMGRLFEREPGRLEPQVRWGLADADPRVRRRVALAAATARGLSLRPLLEPLLADPDPQVRRVIQEVLRRAPPPSVEERAARTESDTVPSEAATVVMR